MRRIVIRCKRLSNIHENVTLAENEKYRERKKIEREKRRKTGEIQRKGKNHSERVRVRHLKMNYRK